MSWKEAWHLKIRRRFRKPFNKLFHSRRYFITRYFGADFLLQPSGVGTLEMSAKISERPELTNFIQACSELRPDLFLDIGANIGMYSCVLLKNGSAPRGILFEPDRKNLVHLRANLLINGLLDRADVREVAVGDVAGTSRLAPGTIDGGFSRLVGAESADGSYEVQVVRLDDTLSLAGQKLAIKIDVEFYECNVLAGMQHILKSNRCLVQIEAFDSRDRVIAMMAEAGYDLVADFLPNYVFDNGKTFAQTAGR